MSENVLEKIIKKKIERIDILKKLISLKSLNVLFIIIRLLIYLISFP